VKNREKIAAINSNGKVGKMTLVYYVVIIGYSGRLDSSQNGKCFECGTK
jgi:hypothetical protein